MIWFKNSNAQNEEHTKQEPVLKEKKLNVYIVIQNEDWIDIYVRWWPF